MRSSSPLVLGLVLLAASARAQQPAPQPAQGFAVERFYLSAPGGGWFIMDSLEMHGGLGGAVNLTVGYERNALRLTEGAQTLDVVQTRAFLDVGGAVTYGCWRFYLNLDFPLATYGNSGTLGDYSYTGPSLNLASNPDTLSDARLGVDVRIIGAPADAFRLGAGVQLFVPSGTRADYDTDGTFRAMVRVLVAGDVGLFTYAGQLGLHIRPLDNYPIPGSPEGSELLFGGAAGVRLPVGTLAFVAGPEVYGATAFRTFFASSSTALEGLLTLRLEGTGEGAQLRFKLAGGGGLNPQFGAPEWRVVLAIELFDY
ncbi:MAG: hypothetical protein ACLQDQ_19455 [Myxococcaceae bacterium]